MAAIYEHKKLCKNDTPPTGKKVMQHGRLFERLLQLVIFSWEI